jgi:hypothetical protein
VDYTGRSRCGSSVSKFKCAKSAISAISPLLMCQLADRDASAPKF